MSTHLHLSRQWLHLRMAGIYIETIAPPLLEYNRGCTHAARLLSTVLTSLVLGMLKRLTLSQRHLCASLTPHSVPQSRHWHCGHQQMLQIRGLSPLSDTHLSSIPFIIFPWYLLLPADVQYSPSLGLGLPSSRFTPDLDKLSVGSIVSSTWAMGSSICRHICLYICLTHV